MWYNSQSFNVKSSQFITQLGKTRNEQNNKIMTIKHSDGLPEKQIRSSKLVAQNLDPPPKKKINKYKKVYKQKT